MHSHFVNMQHAHMRMTMSFKTGKTLLTCKIWDELTLLKKLFPH